MESDNEKEKDEVQQGDEDEEAGEDITRNRNLWIT